MRSGYILECRPWKPYGLMTNAALAVSQPTHASSPLAPSQSPVTSCQWIARGRSRVGPAELINSSIFVTEIALQLDQEEAHIFRVYDLRRSYASR